MDKAKIIDAMCMCKHLKTEHSYFLDKGINPNCECSRWKNSFSFWCFFSVLVREHMKRWHSEQVFHWAVLYFQGHYTKDLAEFRVWSTRIGSSNASKNA